MRAEIVTLFPELIEAGLATSILGRARESGKLVATVTDLRAFGLGGYRRVDDSPYGGGPGMVLMAEPLCEAVDAAIARYDEPCRLLMPSPQGRGFDQPMAEELAAESRPLVILCGHYEGIDERVRQAFAFEEVSVGDYVLTGGELPALTMLDAAARLIEGVLGNADSAAVDSFSEAAERGLKYPQYTRPAEFRGMRVPDVLMSGNHAEIARWRESESERATRTKRPDLTGSGEA